MPNADTNPNVTQGATQALPPPHDRIHACERLRTFDDVVDYAFRAYQHALQRSETTDDAPAVRLWREAAEAYRDAHDQMLRLAKLPGTEAFARAKELLHDANHVADEAEAAAESS